MKTSAKTPSMKAPITKTSNDKISMSQSIQKIQSALQAKNKNTPNGSAFKPFKQVPIQIKPPDYVLETEFPPAPPPTVKARRKMKNAQESSLSDASLSSIFTREIDNITRRNTIKGDASDKHNMTNAMEKNTTRDLASLLPFESKTSCDLDVIHHKMSSDAANDDATNDYIEPDEKAMDYVNKRILEGIKQAEMDAERHRMELLFNGDDDPEEVVRPDSPGQQYDQIYIMENLPKPKIDKVEFFRQEFDEWNVGPKINMDRLLKTIGEESGVRKRQTKRKETTPE